MRKTSNIANLDNQLTCQCRPYTVHGNHNGIFRQLLGKLNHLCAQRLDCFGQDIELSDGGLHQHLRHLIHR